MFKCFYEKGIEVNFSSISCLAQCEVCLSPPSAFGSICVNSMMRYLYTHYSTERWQLKALQVTTVQKKAHVMSSCMASFFAHKQQQPKLCPAFQFRVGPQCHCALRNSFVPASQHTSTF